MTITTYTDREIALRQQLAAATQLAQLNGEIAAELKANKLALEAAIESSRKQDAVLYQRRMKPDYGPHWTTWEDCSRATFKHYLTVPKLRGWTNEARALYAAPVVAPDVLKEIERKNEALLNIARKAEALKEECGDDP